MQQRYSNVIKRKKTWKKTKWEHSYIITRSSTPEIQKEMYVTEKLSIATAIEHTKILETDFLRELRIRVWCSWEKGLILFNFCFISSEFSNKKKRVERYIRTEVKKDPIFWTNPTAPLKKRFTLLPIVVMKVVACSWILIAFKSYPHDSE